MTVSKNKSIAGSSMGGGCLSVLPQGVEELPKEADSSEGILDT